MCSSQNLWRVLLVAALFAPGCEDSSVSDVDSLLGAEDSIFELGGTAITVEPKSMQFEDVQVGEQSEPQSFSLTNSYAEPLYLKAPQEIAGVSLSDTDCPFGGKALAPKKTCTGSIVFSPEADGDFAETFTVPFSLDKKTKGSANVQITILGLSYPAPDVITQDQAVVEDILLSSTLTFSPEFLHFGKVTPDSGLLEKSVTLSNVGNDTIAIKAIALKNGKSSQFTIKSSDCPASPTRLESGKTCKVTVTITAEDAGDYLDQLIVQESLANNKTVNYSVPLALTVEEVEEEDDSSDSSSLVFSKTSHAFGQLAANDESAQYSLKITNQSAGDFYLGSISNAASNPDFSIASQGCPTGSTPLAKGENCTVKVKFEPKSSGVKTFDFTVKFGKTSTGNTTFTKTASFVGEGTSLDDIGNTALDVSPTTYDFGLVATGADSATKAITITNQATRSVYIDSFNGVNANFTLVSHDCPTGGAALTQGSDCDAVFKFNPLVGGELVASVTVKYGLTSGNDDFSAYFPLSGTGISPLDFDGLASFSNISTTGVTLNWAVTGDAIAFIIYTVSGSDLINPVTVLNTGGAVTSYRLTGLSPSTGYSYVVRAIDALGQAEDNNESKSVTTDAIGTFSTSAFAASEGTTDTLDLAALCTDADGSTPTFAIVSESDSDSTCSINGDDLECTPEYKTGHAAWQSTVRVECTINEYELEQDFTVSVSDVNRAPSLAAVGDETIEAGESITAIDVADGGDDADVDLDALAYTCRVTGGGLTNQDCSVLGGTPSFNAGTGEFTWATTFAVAPSGDVAYAFTVTGSDQQGSPLTGTTTFTITVERPNSPSITITDSSPVASQTLNLTWGTLNSSASQYCILENDTDSDNCSWVNIPLPATYTTTATSGSVTLSAWIRDASGGVASRKDSSAVVVDTDDPSWASAPSHSAYFNSTSNSPAVTYTANATDAGTGVDGYEYAVGTGTSGAQLNDVVDWTTAGASPFTATGMTLTHGSTYYLNMRAVDASGRTSAVQNSGGWEVDTVAPGIAVSAPTENQQSSFDSIDLQGTCEAGLTVTIVYGANVSGAVNDSCTGGAFDLDISVGGDPGFRTVTLSQTDAAGNTTTLVRTFERIPEKIAQLAVGHDNNCLLTTNGNIQCWGYNLHGQLSNGTKDDYWTPADTLGFPGNMTALSVHQYNGCALDSDGKAYCWGNGTNGQVGDGGDVERTSAQLVTGLTGIDKIIVSQYHTCAQIDDGLKCWGKGQYGRLGNGSESDEITPADVVGLTTGVADFAISMYSTCALTTSGTVKCWGHNGDNQVGDNTTTNRTSPVDVAVPLGGGETVTGLYMGNTGDSRTVCAKTSVGALYCWGKGSTWQLGNNSNADAGTPVLMDGLTSGVSKAFIGNSHTCVLMDDGGLKCAGTNSQGQLGDGSTTVAKTPTDAIGLPEEVVDVVLGSNETCILLADDSVRCAGYNNKGQLGDGTTSNQNTFRQVIGLTSGVASIHGGNDHFCARLEDGSARCWGSNSEGQLGNDSQRDLNFYSPTLTSDAALDGAASSAISVSKEFSCALTTGGAARCWGSETYGRLGTGDGAAYVGPVAVNQGGATYSKIAAGDLYACAAKSSGGVDCWGYGANGNLGYGSNTAQDGPVAVSTIAGVVDTLIAVPSQRHVWALSGNQLYGWGTNGSGMLGVGDKTASNVPITPTGLTNNIVKVAPTIYSVCSLDTDGVVKCWGRGNEGQLGNGSTSEELTPNAVTLPDVALDVFSNPSFDARFHCAIVKDADNDGDGDVYCWGQNNQGQLGDGSLTNRTSPVQVSGLSDIVSVTPGQTFTYAIDSSGNVYSWGYNGHGQLGDGTTTRSTTPVSVIDTNDNPLSGVTEVQATQYQACALNSSDELYCWGYNIYAQIGINSIDNQTKAVLVSGTDAVVSYSMGDSSTCYSTSAAEVKCFGQNNNGQVGTDPVVAPPVRVGDY